MSTKESIEIIICLYVSHHSRFNLRLSQKSYSYLTFLTLMSKRILRVICNQCIKLRIGYCCVLKLLRLWTIKLALQTNFEQIFVKCSQTIAQIHLNYLETFYYLLSHIRLKMIVLYRNV